MRLFPLPFTCQHLAYTPGAVDAHGNTTSTWASPVDVACFWWTPSSEEPAGATPLPTVTVSGERVAVDVVLVVDSGVVVDRRDRFVVDGRRCEVLGVPRDYNHGPFGFSPGRLVIDLKWTE